MQTSGSSIRLPFHLAVLFIFATLTNSALDECVVTVGPNIGSCQFPSQLVVTSQPTATFSAGQEKCEEGKRIISNLRLQAGCAAEDNTIVSGATTTGRSALQTKIARYSVIVRASAKGEFTNLSLCIAGQ